MFTYSYPRPAVTVDAILVSFDKTVLLIERGKDPYKGKWALPGGFIDMDESLETACLRELQEETGIVINEVKQFKAYGAVGRDPRHRTISVVFYAFCTRCYWQKRWKTFSQKWLPVIHWANFRHWLPTVH